MSGKIETILENRRIKARRALDERRARAFDSCPELLAIEREMADAGLRLNRELVDGALSVEAAREGIAARARELGARRAELLASAGFPADYLLPAPECALCGDTGYVTGGNGLPARCACYYALLRDGMTAASNLPPGCEAGFERFDASLFSDVPDAELYGRGESPRANILRIRDSALRFARSFREDGGNLYFFGKAGTGKTFIAQAIAGELTRAGVSVLYRSAPELFNIFTEHRMRALRDDGYSDALYRHLFGAELLIIDDLGVETATDSRYSEFVMLLNERLAGLTPRDSAPAAASAAVSANLDMSARRGAKGTVISTNMDLTILRRTYDERIFSRVVGAFQIVEFYGDDVRLVKKGRGL